MPSARYIGFEAWFPDTIVRESDAFWDHVPQGITRLALVQDAREELVALDGAPGRRFFFCNEGLAHRGGYGVLAAKVIGYIEGDEVHEVRCELVDSRTAEPIEPRVVRRSYPAREFELHPSALRAGA
jgi:hypothetical protein